MKILNQRVAIIRILSLLLLFIPVIAFGHTDDDGNGFVSGFFHPILGYDHLLAMLSVGVVSVLLGGRNIWTVPSIFVFFMVMGGILGANQILVPYVEFGIAFSVVFLGLAIIYADNRIVQILVPLFVAVFGALHGHAHGVEMPKSASPIFYSFGFVTATTCIHLIGILIAHLFGRNNVMQKSLTFIGAAVAGAGCFIIYGLT